jgi:uncharacterized membrane protein
MTWYTFFKWIHVTAAVIWVGGAAMIQAYALRVLATRDGRRQAEFAKDTEIVGMRVFVPATVVLFLASIGLMINGHWSWGQNWIVFALIVLALSFAVGAGFLGPEAGRIGHLIETEGHDSPAAGARIRRINMISRCELVVLLAVIWNMVVKPRTLRARPDRCPRRRPTSGRYSSSSTRTAPPATRSPSATLTARTTASYGDVRGVSIFIASSTTSG